VVHDAFGFELQGPVFLHIEKIGAAEVLVAIGNAGVDRTGVDWSRSLRLVMSFSFRTACHSLW